MLLVGPPGSGKTSRVLAEFASGGPAKLVVPTASMAEHLLHQMARRGMAISADSILALARFVKELTPEHKELSAPLEIILVEQAVAAAPREFAPVAGYPGFHAKLLETMRDFWSAGVVGTRLATLLEGAAAQAFARVMVEYERLLHKAGAVQRAERLRIAAERARQRPLPPVFFDGFFNFTPVELELVIAVAAAAQNCVVTLPDSGAEESRLALARAGMQETVLDQVYRPSLQPLVVRAASPEREIEYVAAEILRDRKENLRPLQDYGIVLRSPELYSPIIAVVFDRLGIPFHSRQPHKLDGHSSIRYLAGLLKIAATGFDAAETIEVLKLAGSGLGNHRQMDRYDFLISAQPSLRGMETLETLSSGFPLIREKLAQLGELAGWAADRLSPSQWADRCARLAEAWFHPPAIEDNVPHDHALEWRKLAAALRGWITASQEAAAALELRGAGPLALAEFLPALQKVLRLAPLRTPDRRRNVVQVLTVYEARQWELPVVFVCGLVEKQFPRHHSQNILFPDGPRRALSLLGLRLRTTEDLDREERFLFDLARTRATSQLYLTYPARDDSGGETLRSFFLEPWDTTTTEARRVRIEELPPRWSPSPAFLREPALLEALAEKHERLSPSALEKYLQCPFLFFAERTLKLQEPPSKPEQRIDELLKGTIIHRTIARWTGRGGPIGPVFEEVFEEVCTQEGIRLNFRAEALKRELAADLDRFSSCEQAIISGFQPAGTESKFEYTVDHDPERPFRITGRIDRYEVSGARAAFVIDYKYSRKDRLGRLVEEHEEGARLQGPLYLLGLENQFGLTPAGMLFYGLRKGLSRRGWFAAGLAPPDPDLAEKTPGEFRALLERAAARTVEIVREIRDGRVEVKPRDRQFCREYCRYREVCRVSLWGSG